MAGHDLQVLLDAGAVGRLADDELLERFIARQEAAAFEAMARRHGPMVWGVCRRILRDHHDAEDAFQATLLVLARKAAAVRPRDKLAPWLHGVAWQTATRVRVANARRRHRESQLPARVEEVTGGSDGRADLLPILDHEVRRLPDKYRIPVVLCELEGKTHREAADQLGWPIGTVSGRLSRARVILARRLGRSNLADPGVPLVSLSAGPILPARLITTATQWVGPDAVGVVPAAVVSLARTVVRMMMLSKFKTATVLLLGCVVTAGAAGITYRATAADGPGPSPGAPASAPPVQAEPPQPKVAVVATPPAPVLDPPPDPLASYPFKVDASEVYEFPTLEITYREFKLKAGGPVLMLPMKTERGTTGALLLGTGDFEYTPEPGKTFSGHQRAVMLRFNPDEQEAILPIAKGKKDTDRGAAELARPLLSVVVNHCWQRGGKELMIPPKGAMAAVLYSKEHGDLLISFDDRTKTVHNFTRRETLYEKK